MKIYPHGGALCFSHAYRHFLTSVVTLCLHIQYSDTTCKHWLLLVHLGTYNVAPGRGAEMHAMIVGDPSEVLETVISPNHLMQWVHSWVLVIKTWTMTTVEEIQEILCEVHLTQRPPDENCADWCILGVVRLQGIGFLREEELEEFRDWACRIAVVHRQTSRDFQR